MTTPTLRPRLLGGTLAVASALAALAATAATPARAALPVPLTVQEALLPGMSGVARASSPVTVGVPLEASAGITSVAQLGLTGASAAQFRELARWPNGALKWVLVDFQSDLTAGGTASGVLLTTGAGNFGGTNLGSDAGGSIVVTTGAATFTVGKSPFRIFDQVTVGSTPLVTSGSEGFAVTDASGVRYSSSNDPSASVVLEENGPVRCVVRATGTLRSAGGQRLCDYLVRLHFYRGKSYVRAWATMKNASPAGAPSTFAFQSAELVVPLALGTGARFTTETTRGSVSDALGSSETAYVFQARSSRFYYSGNDYGDAPIGSSQYGVEVRKVGGTIYQAANGNGADYAHGWAAVEDASGKGAAIALRWMPQLWPAGLEARGDGRLALELFSKRNAKTSISFAWGAYETRETLFHFYTSAPVNRAVTIHELEYPLVARAPLPQYAAAGAIYGETKLVSAAEQQTWFSQRGGSSPSLGNITPSLWRYYAWSSGGGSNQTDFALMDLIDFLRTGHGGFLAQGERNTLFKSDTAVRHSDGFDFASNQIATGDDPGKDPGSGSVNAGTFNGRTFDFEHPHWVSIPIAYYLTGNEYYREAATDYGEWKFAYGDGASPNYFNPLGSWSDDNTVWNMRIWSRYFRDYALLWDVTRDGRYWTNIGRMVDAILASSDAPGAALPTGRNRDRGYMWMPHGAPVTPRIVSDFMTVQIHFEAAWENLRLLREAGDPRADAFESYLHGLADFIYNEMYLEKGGATAYGDFGYAYSYKLDSYNDPTRSGEGGANFLRPISSARPMALAYELTGDPKYLARGAKLLLQDINYVTNRTPSDYPSHALMHLDLYRPVTGWRVVPGASVQNLGGGSYQLSWVAPSGATGYRIRTADRDIVDWLNYDQVTRAYQFPPAGSISWFAAQPVAGAPTPLPGGSPQSMVVSGLDPSRTWRFSVRYATTIADNAPPASTRDLIAR